MRRLSHQRVEADGSFSTTPFPGDPALSPFPDFRAPMNDWENDEAHNVIPAQATPPTCPTCGTSPCMCEIGPNSPAASYASTLPNVWQNAPGSPTSFFAESSRVYTVERCPLPDCTSNLSTKPDLYDYISCLSGHRFLLEDDGQVVVLSFAESQFIPGPLAVESSLDRSAYRLVEDHWTLDLQHYSHDVLPCPMQCTGSIEVYPSVVAQQFAQNTFQANCSQGHDFDAYVVIPNLVLYSREDGRNTPFDTSYPMN